MGKVRTVYALIAENACLNTGVLSDEIEAILLCTTLNLY